MDDMTLTALWWAVIFSGVYHGINPGMGWPLAVSAALFERKKSAMVKALAMLATGHFLAMIVILLPFSMMYFLIENERGIRIGAGALVIAMGLYLVINRRHRKFWRACIPPNWGFGRFWQLQPMVQD
jgi:cytochrome c biogenesis protein CcdA